jgi:hypothetical protein
MKRYAKPTEEGNMAREPNEIDADRFEDDYREEDFDDDDADYERAVAREIMEKPKNTIGRLEEAYASANQVFVHLSSALPFHGDMPGYQEISLCINQAEAMLWSIRQTLENAKLEGE